MQDSRAPSLAEKYQIYRIFLSFRHPYFLASIQIGSGNTLIFDKISCSLIFSLDSIFLSAIRIEHVLSLNVPYASLFVLFSLCYFYCVAGAVPINSKNFTCSAKIGQILTLPPLIMQYSPNSCRRRAQCRFWLPPGPCTHDTCEQVPLPLKGIPPFFGYLIFWHVL